MSSIGYASVTRNWLSKFNLYKYQSAESENSQKQRRNSLFIVCSVAMISVIIFVASAIAVLTASSPLLENEVLVTDIEINGLKKIIFPNLSIRRTMNQTSTELPPNHRPLRPPLIFSIPQHLVKDSTDNISLNHSFNETEYLLEREDIPLRYHAHQRQRKVKFVNPRYRYWNVSNGITVPTIRNQPSPPKFKNLVVQRRQHDYDAEEEPRPFNFVHDDLGPSEFKKVKSIGKVNNIQDILRQINIPKVSNPKSKSAIQISGSYRHPRGSEMTSILKRLTRRQHNQIQGTNLNEQFYIDPFNSYKPRSPGEINMLATNQFKFMHPSISKFNQQSEYNQPQNSQNVESIYQNIIKADRNRQKPSSSSRTSISDHKHKPFSLMLDIYPMPENDQSYQRPTQRPHKTKSRRPYLPLPAGPGAVNNLPYSYQLANPYYNSMQFSQLQQTRRPPSSNFYENSYPHNQFHDHEDFYQRQYNGPNSPDVSENKPSKIMVHLNLFPKNKIRQMDRSSNIRSNLSPGFDVNSTVSKMDTLWTSTVTTTVALPNDNANEIRFTYPIVVSGEKSSYPESNALNPAHELASKNLQTSTDFQVPQESIVKFRYHDAMTPSSENM